MKMPFLRADVHNLAKTKCCGNIIVSYCGYLMVSIGKARVFVVTKVHKSELVCQGEYFCGEVADRSWIGSKSQVSKFMIASVHSVCV